MFVGCSSALLVGLSGQILLPQYLTNGWSNLGETFREYSLAPTDDLIRFWRSKVKGEGHSRPSRSNLVNTISRELLEQSE